MSPPQHQQPGKHTPSTISLHLDSIATTMPTVSNRVSRRHNRNPSNPEYVAFEDIKDSDCLFGKGKNRMHIGNVAFRALMRSRVNHYQDAPSRGYRVRIIIEALTSIHDAGGRMLRLHDEQEKVWIVMDRDCARDKVGDSIRDIIKTRKRRKIPEAPRNDIVSSLDETATFGIVMNLLTCDIDKRLKKTSKKRCVGPPARAEVQTTAANPLSDAATSVPGDRQKSRSVKGAKTASIPKQAGRNEAELLRQRESEARSPHQVRPIYRTEDASSRENLTAPATEIVIPVGQNEADLVQSSFQQRLHSARSMYRMDQALSDIVQNHARGRNGEPAGLSRFQTSLGGHGGEMHSQAHEEARNSALRRSGSQPPNVREHVISDSAKRLAAALEMQRVARVEIERETRLLSEAHAGSAEGDQGIIIRDLLLKHQQPTPQEIRPRPAPYQHMQDYSQHAHQGPPPRLHGGYYDPIQDLLLARTRATRLSRPPNDMRTHEGQGQWHTAQEATARDQEMISQLTRRGNFEELLAEARALENGPGRGGGFGTFPPPQYPPPFHRGPPPPGSLNHGERSAGVAKEDARDNDAAEQRSASLMNIDQRRQGMSRLEGLKPPYNRPSGQQLETYG